MDLAELNARFTYHAPKGDQPERYQEIRNLGRHFAVVLTENCPESRELSLALTSLEQTVMWANAVIARRE